MLGRLTPREAFALTVAAIIILIASLGFMHSARSQVITISQEQARMAIVKAVGMGYQCRDKGITLASCLTMAMSSIAK